MSEEVVEKRETRSIGTPEARDALKHALDAAGLSSEGKLDLDDVVTLIQEAEQAKEAVRTLPTPDDIMMQTFIASGLDPAMLDTWRATAAEQQIPFTHFVMGHITKAQMSGELNAPARDQGWAVAPEGSGGVMIQTMEYTCGGCGTTATGRLGQQYCSNRCAADAKLAMQRAQTAAERDAQKRTMREHILGLFGIGGRDIADDGLAAISTMLGEPIERAVLDREVNKAKEELEAVGIDVGGAMHAREAASQDRTVFTAR